MKIDLGSFAEVGKVPPDGTYRFLIENAPKVKKSKTAGKSPSITAKVKIIDFPEADSNWENYEQPIWISLDPGSKFFFQRWMKALTGDEDAFSSEEESIEVDDEDEETLVYPALEGVTFMADVTEGEYNGAANLQFANLYPDDGTVEIRVASSES